MADLKKSIGKMLTFANGNQITLKQYGKDHEGEYLILEHLISKPGAINGPHWHPVLEEKFTIVEGNMRFRIDGKTLDIGKGEHVLIRPKQVHQAWSVSDESVRMIHEIRPPGLHWSMFELLHKLEAEGKLNAKGIPRNPLWMGLAWETMDGFIVGPPEWVQRVFLGLFAKLASAVGYTYEK
ncbi:cupin domain-containing protein [Paenibacillus sp. HJGM_3]|uniref:cupin domain-containing protein n=1 Tax=Paenibacillus sp. HJGM_3 TaxID=3379816 RepID=UPI00385B0F7D